MSHGRSPLQRCDLVPHSGNAWNGVRQYWPRERTRPRVRRGDVFVAKAGASLGLLYGVHNIRVSISLARALA